MLIQKSISLLSNKYRVIICHIQYSNYYIRTTVTPYINLQTDTNRLIRVLSVSLTQPPRRLQITSGEYINITLSPSIDPLLDFQDGILEHYHIIQGFNLFQNFLN